MVRDLSKTNVNLLARHVFLAVWQNPLDRGAGKGMKNGAS